MASVGVIPVANETKASSSRITKEGRKITYVMTVIQQPERARACGSGAKSSADRRPVDPPPIVALHVYEGANAENDITFQYNANFFLFATLENARSMAQGRAPPTSQACPVLTGTPVSGNSYLDRPEPAGYFIFPDLSVRHEGKYRLGFSLYEELKELKDMDADETPQGAEVQKSAHVSHRLEVKSVPFTVFSAKKFPGLSESTPLSKMVAEQGCRVRIRRDVRMRRRETKGGQEFDGYDEDHEYARNNRTSATPDVYVKPLSGSTPQMPPHEADRPRSVSNASQVSHITGRRPSVEHVNQTYQQSNPQQYPTTMAPQAPQGMYPPQMATQWQQPLPPANNFMQPPQSYSQPNYQPPPTNGQYNNFAPHQYPSYDHSATFPPPPAGPPVPTSQTMAYPPGHQTISSYGHVEYGRPMHTQMQPAHPHQAMPMQPQYASAPGHSPLGPKHDSISPYQQQVPSTHGNEQHGYYTNASVAPPKFQNSIQPTGATKRTYESSFDVSHMNQPLRQGARPTSPQDQKYAYNVDAVDEDPHTPIDEAAMSYRRADGTERRRRLPSMLI